MSGITVCFLGMGYLLSRMDWLHCPELRLELYVTPHVESCATAYLF